MSIKLMRMRKTVLLLLSLCTPCLAAGTHVIFIVDKVQTVGHANASNNGIFGMSATSTSAEVHTAPGITAEFLKRCPSNITLTQDQSVAEWSLQTQQGGSMLVDKAGTVLYLSPAKTLKNMVKDVCGYLSSH